MHSSPELNLGFRDHVFAWIDTCLDRVEALSRRTHSRQCNSFSDVLFFRLLFQRTLGQFDSGRHFLQDLQWQADPDCPPRSTFFSALHSLRRKNWIVDAATSIFHWFSQEAELIGLNYLKDFPELDSFSVFNGDGHFISHSAHTTASKKHSKTFAAGTIYIQDMRNGFLFPFTTLDSGEGKPHEMPRFKRELLNTPATTFGHEKCLWVLDRAYIDHRWWWKQRSKGHFFVTRSKSNSAPLICGNLPFDPNLPINTGIQSYQLVGFGSSGVTLSQITYKDPETNLIYTFITSLPSTFPPGLIAWLYFKRWTIEKSFDTTKNDLKEKQAWAGGTTALTIQAMFIALVVNFIRLHHETLCRNNDDDDLTIHDTVSSKKFERGLRKREAHCLRNHATIHPGHQLFDRLLRLPSVFVRGVRKAFEFNIPLDAAFKRLRSVLFTPL